MGDPISHLNHREATNEAEAEAAQVALDVLIKDESMQSAAEAGFEVVQ